jgi:hypothetical protein
MVGEHIRTRRDGRWTHAIDCGDATVIHLAQNGDGAARVLRTYRPEFVAGAEAVEVVTHRERTYAAAEIVARALSRISLAPLTAMFRDSEAFAEWCATGRLPPAPPDAPMAVPGSASARAAPAPRPARPAAGAKPPSGAKRRPAPRPKAKARSSASRTAAPKRAARKAAAPARKKAARRTAKPRRSRR